MKGGVLKLTDLIQISNMLHMCNTNRQQGDKLGTNDDFPYELSV